MLISLAMALGGTYLLTWYIQLPDELKEQADQEALNYAYEKFGKDLEELTQNEAADLIAMIKPNFMQFFHSRFLS